MVLQDSQQYITRNTTVCACVTSESAVLLRSTYWLCSLRAYLAIRDAVADLQRGPGCMADAFA